MKKLLLILITIAFFSCEDFLDREPIDKISESSVFVNQKLSNAYLNKLYANLSHPYSGYYMTDLCTDNARQKSGWISSQKVVVPGIMDPSNNPLGVWGKYRPIRFANEYITKIPNAPYEKEFIEHTVAEARWIRAKFYFELVKRYGDVPLILNVQDKEKDDLFVPRTPANEVWKFILDEMTEVSKTLKMKKDLDNGRVSKEAAWALGSRVALYNKEWQKCIEFSKLVMDSSNFILNPDYDILFDSHGGDEEVIFEILFDGLENKGHNYEVYNLPWSYSSLWSSQSNPTQELVDSYRMLNGKDINESGSGYDTLHPYDNRDLRLNATILHHKSLFKGKVMNTGPGGSDEILKSPLHTITGYYTKKHLDETLGPGPGWSTGKVSWKEFRLGEILLNYAEAENEKNGPSDDVYDALDKIRNRAGLPNISRNFNKNNLRIEIRKERRLELAFEDHRWWDLIRWKESVNVLDDKYFHGVKVILDTISKNPLQIKEIYNMKYEVNNRPKQFFHEKNYLQPIPHSEIEKNPNLTQNEGY
jgi:hypothetical protein